VVSLVLLGCGSRLLVAEEFDAGSPVAPADSNSGSNDAGGSVFMCGSARCTNHPTVVLGVPLNGYACCYSAERSACGVVEIDNCIELDQPGHPDPTCQSVTSPQLGNLPGCCSPGSPGTCGSFESNIGIGCIKIPGVTPQMNCTY
jgi:hypothetical protein